jgi:hypothetical protein
MAWDRQNHVYVTENDLLVSRCPRNGLEQAQIPFGIFSLWEKRQDVLATIS